jgi:type I restriction enzyme, S subunit
MSFPRYPKYKDSGVEWLGEVPEHWGVQRLKPILHEVDERIGDRDALLLGLSKTAGVLPRADIGQNASESDDYSKYKECHVGDLVMNKMQAWNGVFGLSAHTGIVSPDYAVFRFHDQRFAAFLTRAFRTDLAAGEFFCRCRGMGTAFLRLNTGDFLDTKIALPPASEVRHITTFLDRETAKIDALIAEQQHLIELLQEKRQAVISHAVTKGLNPDALIKDSGNTGIGQVPAHWDVYKMKWVARMESGHTPDKKIEAYWENCEIPWVSLNDTGYLKDHDYISDTAYRVNELGIANSSARLLPERVVVFSRDATIGRCAITTRPMAVSQHFIAWVCGDDILPEYLLMRLRMMTQELERLTTGATLKTIGMPDVRTLQSPVPPLDEQKSIVAYIQRSCFDIDLFIAEAEKTVALLQERRSALISAAVTGQIDVRKYASEGAAA